MPNLFTAPVAPCPQQLSPEQVEQYRRDGFIAFEGVLDASEVACAKAALDELIDGLRGCPTESRNDYGMVWSAPASSTHIQFQRGHEPADGNDPRAIDLVRKFSSFVGDAPYLAHLATEQANIAAVVSRLVGPDPILSQDMALVNPPRIGTGKPWHQDDAYFKIVPLDAVCGVWIALDDAGEENGCMHVLPGWHRRGALRHYHGSDCEIVPDRLQAVETEMVPVPLAAGGALFFSGIMPHMTRPNTSNLQRRALQYHYRARDSRFITDAEYDAVFIESDGSPASCAAASRRGF
jgi:phytanoyl-CoA hydroxylase